ncbi:MAG: lipid-A-disaccharide synthase N-terminal domain-containing protein [Phycisphaerales bacterium]|nr:MAG: lipid-A-disaccharide synthase N-terminal domain-containing protein [Phycisphaerales bacterium]
MLVVLHTGAVTGAEPTDVPSGQELVDLLKNDRVAMDLVRKDTDLVKEINRRPTLVQVIRELQSDPHVVFYRVKKTLRNPWVIFGFGAQALFFARFVIQWIASERRKRSHVPVAFWYLSLLGGITLFIYAVGRFDPVFMLGQGLGCFIYIRNLILIQRRSAEYRDRLAERAAS